MLQVTQEAMQKCSATVQQLSPESDLKCLRLIDSNDSNDIVLSIEPPNNSDYLLCGPGSTSNRCA